MNLWLGRMLHHCGEYVFTDITEGLFIFINTYCILLYYSVNVFAIILFKCKFVYLACDLTA